MDSQYEIENLYLDAGGVYGFCMCGSLQILKEQKILDHVKNVLACSVGGLIGLLWCLGFETEEITSIAFSLKLNKIINIKK